MKLYRLTQKKFSESPFSPVGAKLYGGRWNSKGTEALYFSQSESLCSLEVFVHVNNDPAITKLYDLYRIEMPEYLIAALDEEKICRSLGAPFLLVNPHNTLATSFSTIHILSLLHCKCLQRFRLVITTTSSIQTIPR